MGRRPQSNPRRGLFRAGFTVIVLIVVLVALVAVVSSLVASTAKAPGLGTPTPPTAPNTPGPLATPGKAKTTPATPQKTAGAKKHKDVSARIVHRSSHVAFETIPGQRFQKMWSVAGLTESARSHALVAAFRDIAPSTGTANLTVTDLRSGGTRVVGQGDPYERPVWSTDGRKLLYVSQRQQAGVPGARWSLEQYDVQTHRTSQLVAHSGLDMEPLGWLHGSPLFTLATQPDTSLALVKNGRDRHLSILMPQVITQPQLSPGGRYVAFVAPTHCTRTCTLDIFDLSAMTVWVGPTGVPNASAFGWSRDGRTVVSALNGRLTAIDASRHRISSYALPPGLPSRWPHQFLATVGNGLIKLQDTVSGTRYVADRETKH